MASVNVVFTTVQARLLREQRAALGDFFTNKYREQAAERGMRSTAANMRKQGVPLHIALWALLGVAERQHEKTS